LLSGDIKHEMNNETSGNEMKTAPFIEDVALHFVELLPKEATGLEHHAASLAGPAAE